MLPSFHRAYCVNGPKQKALATKCDVHHRQFYKWATGRTRCPLHKRQSVDRAMGAKVDWVQYDLEFDACHRTDMPQSAPVSASKAISTHSPPKEPSAAPAPRKSPPDIFEELYGA